GTRERFPRQAAPAAAGLHALCQPAGGAGQAGAQLRPDGAGALPLPSHAPGPHTGNPGRWRGRHCGSGPGRRLFPGGAPRGGPPPGSHRVALPARDVRGLPGRNRPRRAVRGSTSSWRCFMKRFPAVYASLIVLTLATSGCGYNTIQTLDERVNRAQGDIQTQLQRRADLIPNLVETVKGVTQQEDTVFISIANARARLSGAAASGDIPEMAAANSQLNAGLGRLLAIAENYPELRSSENFRMLQDQLEGTENRVAVARTDYNSAVNELNAFVRRFPYNLTAKIFGMGEPREYFEAEAGAEGVPRVQF